MHNVIGAFRPQLGNSVTLSRIPRPQSHTLDKLCRHALHNAKQPYLCAYTHQHHLNIIHSTNYIPMVKFTILTNCYLNGWMDC
jgi:hypothetical protein